MNTHDIEPLQDAADLLRSYLKLCKSLPRGDSYHLGRIERAIAAIEADRKRRGEPVAWRWKWKDLPDAGWQLSSVGGWRETDAIDSEPLYAAPIAPQPAPDLLDALQLIASAKDRDFGIDYAIGCAKAAIRKATGEKH